MSKTIKIGLLFIPLLFPSLLLGQNETVRGINNAIGITFSPKYSKPANLPKNSGNIRGLISYKAGVSALFALNKKGNLFLSTGLGYLNNGLIFKDVANTADLIDEQGNIDYDRITYFDIVSKNNYVFLSAAIGKSIWKRPKGFHLFGALGAQGQYLFSSITSSKGVIIDGQKEEFRYSYSGTDITQNYTVALTGSIGALKSFSDKFSLMFLPYFSYDLNPAVIKKERLDRKKIFYNTGMNLTLLYKY